MGQNAREGGKDLQSEGSEDQCTTVSADARRMLEYRNRGPSLKEEPAYRAEDGRVYRNNDENLGMATANLLSEGFQKRLKDSLEHFTRQQQELARISGQDGREPYQPPPAQTAASSRAFSSPVASLACMGPAARELAQMIHASQQRQHIGDYSAQFNEQQQQQQQQQQQEEGAPQSWPNAQNQQAYQDYWRSPGHYAAQQWGQQQRQSSPREEPQQQQQQQQQNQNFRRPPLVHPFWGTYGPHILPTLPNAAEMDQASQADLTRSIQMLQEAQRLSALASSQIQELYQNANGKKRKPGEEYDRSESLPALLPRPDVPALHALFPPGSEQKCTVCGASNTPVWRRINKALVCNACGLRKRRLVKKSKDSSNPTQARLEEGDLHNSDTTLPVAEVSA